MFIYLLTTPHLYSKRFLLAVAIMSIVINMGMCNLNDWN